MHFMECQGTREVICAYLMIPGGLKPGIPCATFLVKNGPESNFQKKTIQIEQLGLRRGLWGHSFKSSYSLELILDFLEKKNCCVFYVFFLVPDTWHLKSWYLIPLIKIHGGEAKYMVGKPYMVGSPHTWWPGQPAGQLWWGSRLYGGQGGARGRPTMCGFPTMHLASPPCILSKGIRYHVSGW